MDIDDEYPDAYVCVMDKSGATVDGPGVNGENHCG